MATTNPSTHRLASNAQTSISGNYEADLARTKEDRAKLLKTQLGQLGLSTSRNRLYHQPYSNSFDLVPYSASWHVPNFVKYSGDDNKSTWIHISQYVAQLGEASSSNALHVRLFSLSLTGTAFFFVLLGTPNSVHSTN